MTNFFRASIIFLIKYTPSFLTGLHSSTYIATPLSTTEASFVKETNPSLGDMDIVQIEASKLVLWTYMKDFQVTVTDCMTLPGLVSCKKGKALSVTFIEHRMQICNETYFSCHSNKVSIALFPQDFGVLNFTIQSNPQVSSNFAKYTFIFVSSNYAEIKKKLIKCHFYKPNPTS